MKTPNQYFAQILKVQKAMKSRLTSEKYYEEEGLFKLMLKDLLNRDDLLALSKVNLIHFLSLLSTYRPIEPWQILLKFSMAHDQLIKDEELLKELNKPIQCGSCHGTDPMNCKPECF